MATPSDPAAALRKRLDLPDHSGDPQTLVRNVHKSWKSAGGTLGGKPRHSDRFLTEQLKEQRAIVRSLTPKLAGHTRIKRKDAEILLRHFLTHWPKGGDSSAEELEYAPLFGVKAITELVDQLADEYDNAPPPPSTAQTYPTLPGADAPGLLRHVYEQCDALFTVATERAIIPMSAPVPLRGFRNLLQDWWEIEQHDGRERPLIWVADLGRQTYEDEESAQRFLSLHELLVRIKALEAFQDRSRGARFSWLESRAAFIVLDTRMEQPLDMAGFRRPAFLPHHVSFSAIPPIWAKSSDFRALYGSDLDRLNQRTFTVAFKGIGGWPSDEDEDEPRFWRYFGHASFAVDTKQSSERVGRSLELPSPGASYEDAYRTVYAAAVELLSLKNQLSDPARVPGKFAVEQLKYLGFRVLTLSEFKSI
jgi:hypothetical protein